MSEEKKNRERANKAIENWEKAGLIDNKRAKALKKTAEELYK